MVKEQIGIDLSSYQADFTDGGILKQNNIKFAILKLTEGRTVRDVSFSAHYNMCSDADIPVGAYVFSHSTDAAGGRAEAAFALQTLGKRTLKLPIFYDIEEDILSAGKSALMNSALAFGASIKAAGYAWGVYASRSRFGPLLDADALRTAGAYIWCAAYNKTGAGMECDIWQHSDSWKLSDYSASIDSNILYNAAMLTGGDGMSKTEKAVTWALGIAGDPAHGYDQSSRWGPNYDCSSYLISAWEAAGVPVKSRGATYTGNMRSVFKACGFVEVTDGSRQRGDVLLNEQNHTAMYIGDEQVVQASINENGTVTGGTSGDQTGREIYVRAYYDYPWDCVLRYVDDADYSGYYGDDGENDEVVHATQWTGTSSSAVVKNCFATLPELAEGNKGESVKTLQQRLIYWGYDCGTYADDGDFGKDTGDALEAFQRDKGLTPDRICGAQSWPRLIGG